MKKTKSIRFLLSIFVVIITVVTSSCIFFTISYINFQSNKNNLKNLLSEQARKDASLLNYRLISTGKTAVNITDMIETMPVYNEEIIFNKISHKISKDPLLFGIGVWFEPYVYNKEQKYYGPYMYADNNKKTIFTWQYNTPDYDYFSWDWYRVVFNSEKKCDIYFSNLFYDNVMNTYFLTGTSPIIKNDQFIGVATADISLREIARYVNKIRVGYNGYAFVFTNNGYVIGNPPSLIKSDMTKASLLENYDLKHISTFQEENNQEYLALEKTIIDSKDNGLVELKKNQEIAFYAKIGDTGLNLVLIYPQKELYSPFYNTLKYYALIFIFSIIAIPLSLIFVIKKIIDQPLSKLLLKVNKIIHGDYSKDNLLQSVINTNNEFGILGNSVIKLSDSLNELVGNLNTQNTEIRNLAYYDVLTGLPNRVFFNEEVNSLINSYGQENKFAIFFLDLDNFKNINDTYGHFMGDEVLVILAQRIKTLIGEKISASRFGGDEFILIIKDIKRKEELNPIVRTVHRIINKPIPIQGEIFYVSVSIGISIYPDDAPSLNELLKNADTAMFKSKEEGRGNSKFFHKQMNEIIMAKSDLENKLRSSLTNDEFRLYYQPLYDVESAKIVGFEALLRWVTPELGIVMPDKFIKHIEDTRFVIPLGGWVIKTACRFARRLIDLGYKDMNISVNVSVLQIMKENFVQMVMDAIENAGIPAHIIHLEITESKLMESYDLCIQNILKLKNKGVKFAIDDFGTGYSSLNYLKQLPISTLKIDKSFINDLSSQKVSSLIEVIIAMAQKMNLLIVAEGVETQEQLDLLKSFGCNIIQGYLLSKPLTEEDTVSFLNR
ncbi:MAG: EAL domain-containing protein [Dehalobacterium sp.]